MDEAPADRRGIIFIFSAPSGAGKTTLVKRLLRAFPDLSLSVSFTTRNRRRGEVAGRDYHFISAAEFNKMRRKGAFAEWAKVHGFYYGTPRAPLERTVRRGMDVLLDIDVQGAGKIKRAFPDAVSVFIVPPSWRELKKRLSRRGTDGSETIRKRLMNARREIREIMRYDYYVVNQEIGKALEELKAILRAERAKVFRVKLWRLPHLRGE